VKKGQGLEHLIEVANDTYHKRGICTISKTEPIVKIMKKEGHLITKGYLQNNGRLDFEGLLKGGLYITFDAKETAMVSFPLANIEKHQVDIIEDTIKLGGLAFIIAEVKKKTYLIAGEVVVNKYKAYLANRGVRGFGNIQTSEMIPISAGNGLVLDFIPTALTTRAVSP